MDLNEAQQAVDRTSRTLAEAIAAVQAADHSLTYAAAAKAQAKEDGGAARTAYGEALIAKTQAAGGPDAAPITPATQTRS